MAFRRAMVSAAALSLSASALASDCADGAACAVEDEVSLLSLSRPGADSTQDRVKKLERANEALQEDIQDLKSQKGSNGFWCNDVLWCAKSSTCCAEAPTAICGSEHSTCCYDPLRKHANLCAPGSHCNPLNGHCYANDRFDQMVQDKFEQSESTIALAQIPKGGDKTASRVKDLEEANRELKSDVEDLKSGHGASGKWCNDVLWCAKKATCCAEAPVAICGSEHSTCCYDHGKKVANLCAPGSHCNPFNGHCYADDESDKKHRPRLSDIEVEA